MTIRTIIFGALLGLGLVAPTAAQTYDPIPWQEIDRDDPIVERYYPDAIDIRDLGGTRKARVHIATLDHPMGPLTLTMWIGQEYCGINNCQIYIWDADANRLGGANTCDIAELNTIDPSHQFIRLCSDTARAVEDMLWNYDPPSARNSAPIWQHDDIIYVNHNGSVMAVSASEGTIRYHRVRDALRGSIADGTILFQGQPWQPGGPFSGTAYTFRKGCDPAPYAVTASYQGSTEVLTLKGDAPVRPQGSCTVTGYTADSGNAVLEFHTTFD